VGDELMRDRTGVLQDGATYLIRVPQEWNGTLLLHCPGFSTDPSAVPPLAPHPALTDGLLEERYALASVSYASPGFWAVEHAFSDLRGTLDVFAREVRRPDRTIAWGNSIGGIITAGLVQLASEYLSGAMPMCGSVAGGVGTRNQNLDCSFVLKCLLAADSPLECVRITSPDSNVKLAQSILETAQGTPQGRARIALAATLGGIPGWFDPSSDAPAADDHTARQLGQFRWLQEVALPVFVGQRALLERRAGGNPSWNAGVDYRRQLDRAGSAGVAAEYACAGLDIDADLSRLDSAQRIEADPHAVSYLERYVVFNGDLAATPVLAMHTLADGLVVVESEQAYYDVVSWANQSDHLRQVYVARAAHCSFTAGEILAGLHALIQRIDLGRWPALDAGAMNDDALRLAREDNTLRTGQPPGPCFAPFEPSAFLRPYDVRDVGTPTTASRAVRP